MAKKKGPLASPFVPAEEQPYPIPENWCWTYLTGFAECLDSFRRPINATERIGRNGNIPYYGATGQVGWIDDFLTNEQLVLVGEDGAPFLDRMKDKAYMIEGKAWVNNHAHILRSYYGSAGNFYLLNYLNCFDYTGYVNGTTRLKLTQSSMNTIPVPVAPISEQHRIVARIESLFAKLDEAKEKAQAVVDGFELRKSAILHKAFTGELTQRWRKEHGVGLDSWKKTDIESIADVKGGKRIPKGMSLTTDNTGHPYIKAGNLKLGTVLDEGIMFVPDDVLQYIKNYTVTAGDVYITNVGACIGDCGIIPDKYDGANLTENAVKITNLKCNGQFLAWYISSNGVQQRIKNLIASATLGKLSIANIKTISVSLPTIEEQAEIVCILEELQSKEQQAKEAAEFVLTQIDAMKKAILVRAFRGELGTNDPAEEWAGELVKTII